MIEFKCKSCEYSQSAMNHDTRVVILICAEENSTHYLEQVPPKAAVSDCKLYRYMPGTDAE